MYRFQGECVAYTIEYVTYSRGCVAYTVEYVTYSGDMYLACMSSTSFNLRQRSSYIGCESIFGESKPSEHKIWTTYHLLGMTCYWRQRYVISKFNCSWRNYLMIVSLSYACCTDVNPINSVNLCSDSILVHTCLRYRIPTYVIGWQQRWWDRVSIKCCLSASSFVWWAKCLNRIRSVY